MNISYNPIVSFAVNFDLGYNKTEVISFDAVINFCLNGQLYKIQTEIQIRNSETQLMDTFYILHSEIDTQVLPTIFYSKSDIINYMPNQFLTIKGNNEKYGNYSVLIFHPIAKNSYHLKNSLSYYY